MGATRHGSRPRDTWTKGRWNVKIARYLAAAALLTSAATGASEGAPHPAPRVSGAASVPPPRYKIVDLGTLFPDSPPHNKGTGTPSISITTSATYSRASSMAYSMAYSINDRGQIVGYGFLESALGHHNYNRKGPSC